jgi:DHA2 family multidrug resistance protein-like MFS transporter
MTEIEIRAGRREWIALSVLCLPLLMVSMDVSILFFAVPHIAADLHPTGTELLWIFDGYGFVLAGLLLTMGSLADRIGRRRLLLIGAAAFGAASILAAYAPSSGWLIAARGLLGVGGSTLMPSTLAIVRNAFAGEADRAKAIGIWSAVMAGGVGIGPVLAGVLLDHFFWGSVFLVNVPVMAALLLAGPALLPESRDPSSRVDLVSAGLSLATILPVIQAIKQGAADGWSLPVLGYAACGLLAGAAFLWRQLIAATPMVDLSLFSRRGFGGSIAVQVLGMFGVMGNAVLITQYLQSVLGFSPLSAALWSLVPSAFVGGAAPAAVVLAGRIGRPPVMAGGFLVGAVGFLFMRTAQVDSALWRPLVGASFVAIGLVSVATLVTEYAVGVAPPERAGAVSALVETMSEFGGALGMAVLGSIAGAAYTARMDETPTGMPSAVADAARRTLGEAVVVADQVGSAGGEALLGAARTAYVQAMHLTDLVAAGVLVVGAVIAAVTLPRRPIAHQQGH